MELTEVEQVDAVLRTMAEIVNLQGTEHVYEKRERTTAYRATERDELLPTRVCLYVFEGQPDCLGGQVLHRLGWADVEQLEGLENQTIDMVGLQLDLAPGARDVLTRMQQAQDMGLTWGAAVAVARRQAEQAGFPLPELPWTEKA